VARAEGEDFAAFPGWADGRRGASLRRGVPRAGEHSREVLVELGFDDAEIADLVRSGAVKAH
jgi:crotonobetainyl-CoA:carnitine CoA-transferase CaiB-like acyl-CoA transferase